MHLGVVDYGASNIHSVARALKSLGSKVSIVDTPDKFKSIDKLVFPGQGSMGSCIKKLNETEMINPLSGAIKSKPFLGFCLGLQILFDSSEESKESGLGVINGSITKIKDINKENLKIPHMGWAQLLPIKPNTLLDQQELNNWVYFVHSYHAIPDDFNIIAAQVNYGSEKLTAIIENDNLLACQFHPEKSGKTGEKLLRRWLSNIQ